MRRVFSRWQYTALASAIALCTFSASVLVLSLNTISQIAMDPVLSIGQAFSFSLQFMRAAFLDLSRPDFAYAAMISVLLGINVTLLVFAFRMYRTMPSSLELTGSGMGVLAAILGFGCAACGSLFLTAFAASIGGAGLTALLPYGGKEVGILGIILLLWSSKMLTRSINTPSVCPM